MQTLGRLGLNPDSPLLLCRFFHEHMPMAKIIAFCSDYRRFGYAGTKGTSVAVAKGGEVHGH